MRVDCECQVTRMPKYDPRKVQAVRCPKCGSASGERCRTANGKATSFHTLRKGVVYRRYIRSSSGAIKRGVTLPKIKITATYLQYESPQQGEAMIDGTRVLWERDGLKYLAYELSDDDWERIEKPPSSEEDMAELSAIWAAMKSRAPFMEFHHEDAEWGTSA